MTPTFQSRYTDRNKFSIIKNTQMHSEEDSRPATYAAIQFVGKLAMDGQLRLADMPQKEFELIGCKVLFEYREMT